MQLQKNMERILYSMCVSFGISIVGVIDPPYPVGYITQKPSEGMDTVGTSVTEQQ